MCIIEIYGVSEEDYRCHACMEAKKIVEEAGLDYTFTKVLSKGEKDGMPVYDRPTIEALAKRAKFQSLNIRYPVIFINDQIVRIKNLRSHLFKMGYDVDVF